MGKLKVKELLDWEVVGVKEECVTLQLKTQVYQMEAKIQVMGSPGNLFEIQKLLKSRFQEGKVIDSLNLSFIHRNLKWHRSSFVCLKPEEKYHYFYYTFFDQQCIMMSLITGNEKAALRFQEEAYKLLDSVDYDSLRVDNIFFVKGKEYSVKTPLSYKFSLTSTKEHLLFLRKESYIVVNVEVPENLTQAVKENEFIANLCIDGCKIQCVDGDEGNVRYQVLGCKEEVTGVCTYVRNRLPDGVEIVSFVYQKGETIGEKIDFCFAGGV